MNNARAIVGISTTGNNEIWLFTKVSAPHPFFLIAGKFSVPYFEKVGSEKMSAWGT